MNMWSYFIEKFRECVDFICLNNVIHKCYEECKTRSAERSEKKEFPDDVNECYAICNELYEENARLFD